MVTYVLVTKADGKFEKKPVKYATIEEAYAEEEAKGNKVEMTWIDESGIDAKRNSRIIVI